MKRKKISFLLIGIVSLLIILNLKTEAITKEYSSGSNTKAKKNSEYINPFIGTAGDHGQTDPSANIPFGMIKPGPDTDPGNHSGYNYNAEKLIGFSQTRASGIGCHGVGGNLRILPFTNINEESAGMDKNSESASAGFYSIKLTNGIFAEVTSGRTTAFYRFIYPEKDKIGLSIDFKSTFSQFIDENHVIDGNEIYGWIKCKCACEKGQYKIYYYLKFDKTPQLSNLENGKLKLIFDSEKNNVLQVRIALSSVSEKEAKNNLEQETGSVSFEQLKNKAAQKWEKLCETIDVETDNDTLKTLFYTHLYHSVQIPFNIIDYSGTYRSSDGKIYDDKNMAGYYTGWSLWDTFRTKLPLLSILFPKIYSEMMSSVLDLYEQGKSNDPKMTESFLTIRNEHSLPVILDAYRKNLIKKSLKEFLPQFVKETDSLILNSPDRILEGCYDFWSLAELAKELGAKKIEEEYRVKALSYRKMWKNTFLVMDKNSDIMHGKGLYEGTLWQYRWFVPYDMEWVAKTIGSNEKAISQLDYFFDKNLFNIGNQPDIQVPFLYYNFGQPWKSESLVRKLLLEPTVNYYGTHTKWNVPYVGKVFRDNPEGFLEEMDDDAGTMSSWFVLASVGLYPVCVGQPEFWILPPIFDSVTINVSGNKKFTIKNIRNSPKDIYISKALLNGETLNRSYLKYFEIMNGGMLKLYLSDKPNTSWGNN